MVRTQALFTNLSLHGSHSLFTAPKMIRVKLRLSIYVLL